MYRLLVLVEGETEETFVNEILRPHLSDRGFSSVTAKAMGNARLRSHRKGVKGWDSIRKEIIRHLTADTSLHLSMMVDYYGLPKGQNNKAWPGRLEASDLVFQKKAQYIENSLIQDLSKQNRQVDSSHFIPYIMMHEFEALLFSDCLQLAKTLIREDIYPDLQKIRDQYSSPEEINDSPETHPSKRIKNLVPEYEKPLYGNLAILDIGLETLRSECIGFAQWLQTLESIAKS